MEGAMWLSDSVKGVGYRSWEEIVWEGVEDCLCG